MARAFGANVIKLGAIELHSGSVDPSAGAGVDAPIGSVYYRSSSPPTTYRKFTSAATGWALEGSTPPASTVAPVISGTGQVGQTLTSTTGTFTGSPTPTITYQWYADGIAIVGATANTYLIVSGDTGKTITDRTTGTSAIGTATSAASNGIVVSSSIQQVAVRFTGAGAGATLTISGLGGLGGIAYTVCGWVRLRQVINTGAWWDMMFPASRRVVTEYDNLGQPSVGDSQVGTVGGQWLTPPGLNNWYWMSLRGPAVHPGTNVATYTLEDGSGGLQIASHANGIENSLSITAIALSNNQPLEIDMQYVRAFNSRLTDQQILDERTNSDPTSAFFWMEIIDNGGNPQALDASGNGRLFTISNGTLISDGPTCPTVT